ncbi:MAG: C39 family peptidase, partial [Nocardioides sp.]
HREGAGRQAYTWAAWLSPEVRPGFGFTELVPSWNARTPDDSWLVVEARVSVDGARWSRWHCLAEWAETDDEVHRSSRVTSPGPGEDGSVDVDVLQAVDGVAWTAYQLRVTLLRRPGSDAEPQVRLLGAMVSSPGEPGPASPGGAAWGVELAVPEHSQQLHRDTFPQYAGGGEAWCSPSSTAMVLETFDLGPRDKDYAWVPQDATDPTVVHAARSVYDHGYGICGNWTMNVAYAGRFGAEAFVTRLRSLAEMETLVAAGIPVVATVAFAEGGLPGAGYDTEGHLLVVRGFTTDGDVVVNDPASHLERSNDAVRVVYDRAAFERVWLGAAAAGVVYVVHPADVPLPEVADPAEPNW